MGRHEGPDSLRYGLEMDLMCPLGFMYYEFSLWCGNGARWNLLEDHWKYRPREELMSLVFTRFYRRTNQPLTGSLASYLSM